jgi:hypothetical protein
MNAFLVKPFNMVTVERVSCIYPVTSLILEGYDNFHDFYQVSIYMKILSDLSIAKLLVILIFN